MGRKGTGGMDDLYQTGLDDHMHAPKLGFFLSLRDAFQRASEPLGL